MRETHFIIPLMLLLSSDKIDLTQASSLSSSSSSLLSFFSAKNSLSSSNTGRSSSPSKNLPLIQQRSGSTVPTEAWQRYLDQANNDDGTDDDQNNDDDNDDYQNNINEQCSEYLVSFLEGTTDAKDTCEGIENAYSAANCIQLKSFYSKNKNYDDKMDDQDDYFGQFYEHKCCQSLLSRHAEYCDDSGSLLSNMHLLLVASVLLLCEMAKSLVKSRDIHFLPEAAVCIIVGTVCGLFAHLVPGLDINDLSFDGELFLTVLLPPIIFEAALSVSKKDFRRRRLAIFMFAVVGTIMSTFMTGFMVHYGSLALKNHVTIPFLDSFIFGALISSIDPVAILSVLTSLNMNQTDTVFILVFGESLLNDGIAITMSQSLINRFTEGGITTDEVLGAVADFLIVCVGSFVIGFVCALMSMVYFWLFRRVLTPGMEVGSFFLWALIPYWISDGLEWSGIVSIVTMGFFMDIYIAKPLPNPDLNGSVRSTHLHSVRSNSPPTGYIDMGMSFDSSSFGTKQAQQGPSCNPPPSLRRLKIIDLLRKNERIRLSREADKHVRFVAHLMASLSENAIFAYLGLFLFSQHYDWDGALVTISIIACILSRAIMVAICCWGVYQIHYWRRRIPSCGVSPEERFSRTATTLQERSTQLVLIFAGLRGAVSLALVENVPIYNAVTEEGCEYKPLLKAMTSASIIFTMFVFGGSAYYIFPLLGIQHDDESVGGSLAGENPRVTSPTETELTWQEPPEVPFVPPASVTQTRHPQTEII